MRRPLRSRLRRLGGATIPWAVAIFLVLVAGEEEPAQSGFDVGRSAAMVLAVVQGAALHWRRERPEIVTAVVLRVASMPSTSGIRTSISTTLKPKPAAASPHPAAPPAS